MSPDDGEPGASPGDGPDDRDDRDDPGEGTLGRLLGLLETLAEMDRRGERHREGRTDIGGTSVDFSIDVGSVDDLADAFGGRGPRPNRGRRPGYEGPEDQDRTGRTGGADSGERRSDQKAADERPEEALVDVRETESGAVVVADLPTAVDEDDVDVTVDGEAGVMRIAVDGEPLGAAPLADDELTITDATVRNRVLEVHLRRSER